MIDRGKEPRKPTAPGAPVDDLHLHEALLLLALHDEKGTVLGSNGCLLPLGGALLADLLLDGLIRIDGGERERLVHAVDGTRHASPLLDECLAAIRKAARPAGVQRWIARFATIPRLKHRVADGLCGRGILRKGEHRALRIFRREAYPTADPRPERWLVKELWRDIASDDRPVPPHLAALVGLAYRTGILHHVFDAKFRRKRKERIEQIVKGDAIADAALRVVVDEAIIAACV